MKYTRKFVGVCCLLIPILAICGFRAVMVISDNKRTVLTYMDGFREGDHAKILSCLTADVVWEMPGVYHHRGKLEFDKEIENEAFVGRPQITIVRMVEESDVVVAEGTVEGKRKDGSPFNAVFCDVFLMRSGKIKKLTSYLMVVNP